MTTEDTTTVADDQLESTEPQARFVEGKWVAPENPENAPPDVIAAQELTKLQERMAELRIAIGSEDNEDAFDSYVAELAGLMVRSVPLRQQVNAKALNDAKSALGNLIHQAVDTLNLAELMGQPIRNVHYEWVVKDDEAPILVVGINQGTAATKALKTPRAAATPSNGDKQPPRDLKAIFEAKATPEDQAEMAALEAEKANGTITAQVFGSKAYVVRNRVASRG
tara:strand:+ start:57 stop:728 length:672 start_codon:yes stop_codon:yes gene_type:complete